MKMKQIKKINILSLAIILMFIQFIIGIFSAIIFLVIQKIPEATKYIDPSLIQGGYNLLWTLPITYALTGFLMGLVFGLLYNLIAYKIGGIKIELTDVSKPEEKTAHKKKR